ncbi:MAG TPA: sialidase family protein [Nevskiaceae bacterium]|nr:sialidase family protein [Nevskiaceae bacterium]
MKRPALAVCASLPWLLAAAAHAATPANGTLSPAQPQLTYSSGPFVAGNATAQTSPGNPTCQNPALPCDDFALTLSLPADYAATHPRALVTVSTYWAVTNQIAYNLYLLDATGKVLNYVATGNDPVTLSLPAGSSTQNYTLRIVPQQAAGETPVTTVTLQGDPTGGAASGLAPRFIQQQTPPGLGDNTNGEMNIGYNPLTGHVMTLGYTQTLRTTWPEVRTPALPEACDALWEDVSDPDTQINTNDPILSTDPHTGRTFVSQLQVAAGESIFAYSDDDGANWTLSPSTLDGGVDHQTVGGGPYPAGGSAAPSGSYPDMLLYCSQSIAAAFCIRSDDGGATFGLPNILKTAADCGGFLGGIHGHVRIGDDGTAYVPDRNCNGVNTLHVSTDAGATWQHRPLPASATAGDGDPSVGVAHDGTVYFCYLNGDTHVHVAVSHDQGQSWINDRDIGYAQGVIHAVFPQAVAGDGDRAACAFLGTTTPGNYQATDFTGIWHTYIATTYDGGNTWHTVNPTPDDPVQGTGGICLGGTTCVQNRNLLDFNEITADDHGRVLFGFDDGCVSESCITTGVPDQVSIPGLSINSTAKTTVLRQSGGRTLLSQFDPAEPAAPKAACLAGARDASKARLTWKFPDNGGAAISAFRIFRGDAPGAESYLATTGAGAIYEDANAGSSVPKLYYRITALNSQGESVQSNEVELPVGDTLPDLPGGTTSGGTGAVPPAQDSGRYGGALDAMLLLPLLIAARQRRVH